MEEMDKYDILFEYIEAQKKSRAERRSGKLRKDPEIGQR
jgi:hypothetical protein